MNGAEVQVFVIFAWCFVACYLTVFFAGVIRHWLWTRQGDALSREFDELCRERETDLDPRVVLQDGMNDDERDELRADIEDLLERFEDHARRRREHLQSFRLWP